MDTKQNTEQADANFGADLEPFLVLMESMCRRGAGVKQVIKLDETDVEMWSRLKPFLIRLPALLQTLEAKLKAAEAMPVTKLDWYIGIALMSGDKCPVATAVRTMEQIPSYIEQLNKQKEQDNEPKNNDS